jgi:hypothetical protein
MKNKRPKLIKNEKISEPLDNFKYLNVYVT